MSFTEECNFQNALFYPASGGDVQPLISFSGQVDTFIYVDFHEAGRELVSNIAAFNKYDRRGLGQIMVSARREYPIENALPIAQTEKAWDYLKTVIPMTDLELLYTELECEQPYQAEVYEMTHILDGLQHPFKVVFIHYEGFVSYLLLSGFGKTAPKILCTVVSDRVPFEIYMPVLLQGLQAKPELCLTSMKTFPGYDRHLDTIEKWEGTCEQYVVKAFGRIFP